MYELLYIVPAPLTEKDLPNVSKKVNKIIKDLGGKIVKEENLGNKKLAYPIKQVYRGFYILVYFETGKEILTELNKVLELDSEILRHMIVRAIKKDSLIRRPRKSKQEKEKATDKEPVLEDEIEKKKEETEEKGEIKGKIALKKLGKKIDDLFNI